MKEKVVFFAGVVGAAFVLNFLWEHAHSVLYVHYQGGEITDMILFRAAINDALFIAAIVLLSLVISARFSSRMPEQTGMPRMREGFIVLLGFLLAVGLEWWALETSRWAYGPEMPIIPILGTGLTPTIQLALLGLFSFWIGNTLTALTHGRKETRKNTKENH